MRRPIAIVTIFVTCLALSISILTAAVANGGYQDDADGMPFKYGHGEPRLKPNGAIRIAAYNLNHLYDHEDDPAFSGEHDDMQHAISHERATEIARVIRLLDADVLALQEVESLDALAWFRDEYVSDMGYQFLASKDVGYYRAMECSLLSRFEITNVEVRPQLSLDEVRRKGPGWDEVPFDSRNGLKIQRSPLRVDLKISDDYELTLFVLHHKSGGNFRFQREAEAVVVNDWIDEIEDADPARNVIALGDFNAAPWDKSFRIYLERGFVDTLAHRIIPRWRDAPQAEANLYKTHESGRVLDYILMNSPAYREYIVGSAHVVGTYYPPSSYDWRTDPFPAGYASDHYPVIADITPKDLK